MEKQNERDTAKTFKEAQGVSYVKSKVDLDNPEMVLQMYNKIVEQELFETPVGFAYLQELHDFLKKAPEIKDSDIRPLPWKKTKSENAKTVRQADHAVQEKPSTGAASEVGKVPHKVKAAGNYDAKGRKPGRREAAINYKARFKAALSMCVILSICIVAMFVITSTTNNATVLNYETEIINRYEDWEQDLNEREQKVKEREEELGIE
jgi:hypothetical protein